MAVCALGVTGCSLDDILMESPKTAYALRGPAADEGTATYLQTVLDERIKQKAAILAEDDPDLRARQEHYIEQTVRADLLKALHARGYYSASVAYADGGLPLTGHYDIDYGPRFTIDSLRTDPEAFANELPRDTPATGDALDAATILGTQSALLENIGKDRCYFDLSVDNRVRLDRRRNTGAVEFVVTAGREGHFGALTFQGNGRVKESHLNRLVPWEKGDCFRREKLEAYKTALLQSGLFAQAEILLPDTGPDAKGQVPVTLALKERAARTIGAGLTYYSDEGPGGTLSWEHRNLFGAAEKLETALNLSLIKQSLEADFTKPYFMRDDQSLSLSATLRRQDTDAFEEMAIDSGAAVSRTFGKHLSVSTGIDASLLRITDITQNTTETYALLSAPQSASYDTRNDRLDPLRGINLALTAEPFFDFLGQADPFFKMQLTGSFYYAPGSSEKFVIATKGSVGTIWGAEMDSVPATERFYAGGGGSVRGYGYQEVGPRQDDKPAGGLSLATLSLELRSRFTDKIGGVAFIDAGSVSAESTPDLSNMAVGAGVGVRYYTSFGPLRFDVATPLTQKQDTDQNYQFYISIGQAF